MGGKAIAGLDHPEGPGHPEGTRGEFRAASVAGIGIRP